MAMTPYWQDQTAGFYGGINNLGRVLMQAPAMKAMAAQRQAQAQLREAQMQDALARVPLLSAQTRETLNRGDLVAAQAEETKTKAGRGKLQLDAANRLGQILAAPGAVTQDAAGNYVFAKDAMEATVPLIAQMGTGANDAASGLGNIFKAGNATVQARLTRETAANKPLTVSPGAAVVTPDGKPIYKNPSAAQQDTNYQTTTEEYPAVAEKEGTHAQPALDRSILNPARWFGEANHPAVPAVPAVPAQPARKVTRRETITPGLGVTLAQPQPQPAATAQAPATLPAPPAGVSEVQRQTKDGRIAIFDANTKQFLRYAQ